MAVFLNTIGSLSNPTQEYQIEGVTYYINCNWNYRNGWQVSIFNEEKVPLITGLLAVPNQNITWRYSRSGGLFTGDLWVDDTEFGNDTDTITKDNFGQGLRYRLVYRTQAEMNEANINPRSFNA